MWSMYNSAYKSTDSEVLLDLFALNTCFDYKETLIDIHKLKHVLNTNWVNSTTGYVFIYLYFINDI